MKRDLLGPLRRTHYTNMITSDLDGAQVILFGWVQEIRDLGNLVFVNLRDKEGVIQITATTKNTDSEVFEKIKMLSREFAIGVSGLVKKRDEAPRGIEILPQEIKILSLAKHPLPLDPTGKVPAEIDVRLDARILDLRSPESQAIFKIRHEIVSTTHRFLGQTGHLEIHTPRIIAAAAEGGATLFPVEYFEKKAFLAQSPELYKEELSSVFEKVYEIGGFFRAEESHTRRHLNEFISVDVEEAFVDVNDVMKLQEELIFNIIKDVNDKCTTQLKILGVKLPTVELPLKRYTYSKVIDQLKSNDFKIEWGEDLSTPACRVLGEIHQKEFYFIDEWPTVTRPFYIKPRRDKNELCEAFDFMYEWVEITSGGTRVDDPEELISRLKEQGLNPENFDFHLKTYYYGMPPHAGWGMGLDRLVMAILARDNIRDVVLFPRDRVRLKP